MPRKKNRETQGSPLMQRPAAIPSIPVVNSFSFRHSVQVNMGWDLRLDPINEAEIGAVTGYGSSVVEAKKDAYRKAITVLMQYAQTHDFGREPQYSNEYRMVLLRIAEHKAFIDEYSEVNCIGYGGIFPWYPSGDYIQIDAKDRQKSNPKFAEFLKQLQSWANGRLYSYSTGGGYWFSIPAYSFGKTIHEAHLLYLQKVAVQLALLIRRETDLQKLYDCREAAGKLDVMMGELKARIVKASTNSQLALQDILEPEKSWKAAPQYVPCELENTNLNPLEYPSYPPLDEA